MLIFALPKVNAEDKNKEKLAENVILFCMIAYSMLCLNLMSSYFAAVFCRLLEINYSYHELSKKSINQFILIKYRINL